MHKGVHKLYHHTMHKGVHKVYHHTMHKGVHKVYHCTMHKGVHKVYHHTMHKGVHKVYHHTMHKGVHKVYHHTMHKGVHKVYQLCQAKNSMLIARHLGFEESVNVTNKWITVSWSWFYLLGDAPTNPNHFCCWNNCILAAVIQAFAILAAEGR